MAKKSTKAAVTKNMPVQDPKGPSSTTSLPINVFPIIGIGASAGGLAAFEEFFSGMPSDVDPDMAFILVQHLAPDHKSILTELVRRYTRMRVYEVVDGMVVTINCTYIIPPNHDMALFNGKLQLLEPAAPRGHRLPIDFFFRSLAFDQRERAIGIVLSGTGSDGTLGVQAIKGEGGMVMVQTPESTEYDGMPRSAVATGKVDFQLQPRAMAAELIAYAKSGSVRWNPLRGGQRLENDFEKIFVLLRTTIGHDFSQYKINTIQRRIERRMSVNQIKSISAYVTFLQKTNTEVTALFRELLIGVTSFFRDTSAFSCLEEIAIPKIIAIQAKNRNIRIWVPACSTGEEAYSIAILLKEKLDTLQITMSVQIFATDIDQSAIEVARNGVYPGTIIAGLTDKRLTRNFTMEANGNSYRINKNIRDMLIFSVHDLVKDPPFSKLNLISCRNVMIYMTTELQRKIIPLFHYSLNIDGLLFLGTSEGVSEFTDLFEVIDRKAKLFQRVDDIQGNHRLAFSRLLVPSVQSTASKSLLPERTQNHGLALRQITEQNLLQHIGSAGALVNARGDILYLYGRSGQYLEPTPGETMVNNILKMARPGLQFELTTALNKAAKQKKPVHVSGVRVRTNGHHCSTNLTVRPILEPTDESIESPLFLVVLDSVEPIKALEANPVKPKNGGQDPNEDKHIAVLMQQLRTKEEYLQAANEELETSNEELQSTNEEMQSVNEELQSTNEELETSREELQSVNEELSTVNTELQHKLLDLARLNNDMNNLLAGTGIATIFVDHQLRIMRFTPMATAIINLIVSDEGRPVAHIASNLLNYNTLVEDIQSVLKTLMPHSIEVLTKANKWYLMRVLPYRTLDNVIEGAVLTFVDVTEIRAVRKALDKANELRPLVNLVLHTHDAITVIDILGRITAWNPAATRIYGWTEAEARAFGLDPRIPQHLKPQAIPELTSQTKSPTIAPYLTERLTKAGELLSVWMIPTALFDAKNEIYAIATIERPVTEEKNENSNS
ncbi:chemotaxis protein CheB [Reinekea sp.]|uniref:chemotaxis protein CheB n=1 Tax=Reinekea sp. TaxID=1970455 RepID=UPI002A826C9B|nr:chemotaxis protein CheB [Reinekea sp.]